MSSLKAIQTRYKGYHFRSRLEARWAVFFDTAGIKWEYEVEGFQLPNGTRYLPDFKLLDIAQSPIVRNAYVEVKPEGVTSLKAKALASTLASAWVYGEPVFDVVILLDGAPWAKTYDMYVGAQKLNGLFAQHKDGRVGLGTSASPVKEWGSYQKVWEAVNAARGARFEHGQSGATT